jgi:hypothetical protein
MIALLILLFSATARAIEFKWDAFNRLVETNGIRYLYDPQGRRCAKLDAQTGEFLRIYIYHNWQMLAVYDGQGKVLFEFVDGGQYIDEHICIINY